MTPAPIDALARAVLYEGYLLYPYRRSSTKNREPWMLGGLHPPAFAALGAGDRSTSSFDCIVVGSRCPRVRGRLRFLQLVNPTASEPVGGGATEAIERDVALPPFDLDPAGETSVELAIAEGEDPLTGAVHLRSERTEAGAFRLSVRVENRSLLANASADRVGRRRAALRALASAHVVLEVEDGTFVSMIDPPDEHAEAVAASRNDGLWPILVGEPGSAVLASPIILEDFPAIAPESPGDFFDATEIDELLSLRILTLTDAEKSEMKAGDSRARELCERVERLDEEALGRLHGVLRFRSPPAEVSSGGRALAPGHRVRLAPRRGGDVFDIALAGMTATIESIEQDLEGRVLVAVTVDDDPGRDLGRDGKPGHRFYFRPEEVLPL